jgi:hypothetical protein
MGDCGQLWQDFYEYVKAGLYFKKGIKEKYNEEQTNGRMRLCGHALRMCTNRPLFPFLPWRMWQKRANTQTKAEIKPGTVAHSMMFQAQTVALMSWHFQAAVLNPCETMARKLVFIRRGPSPTICRDLVPERSPAVQKNCFEVYSHIVHMHPSEGWCTN